MARYEHRVGSLKALRRRNRGLVVAALRDAGTVSRAEIARVTGLSRSTVSTLVGELQDEGLVVERPLPGSVRRTIGRPPVLLSLDSSAGAVVGVDAGHRRLRVAVSDLGARVLAERQDRLDEGYAVTDALSRAAVLAADLLAEVEIDRDRVLAAGLGLPGLADRAAAAAHLAQLLGLPVEADNDANLGARGELALGAARGESDVVYVRVASGIGAGIVVGGRMHQGVSGVAGEIGHVEVRPGGAPCRCGRRGCLETVAAIPPVLDALRRTHGADLDGAALARLARQDDPAAQAVLGDAGRAIGRVLADLCNHLNPGLVVVGGDPAATTDALVAGVREAVERHALPAIAAALRVVPGALGDRAELFGALTLAAAEHEAAHRPPIGIDA